MLANLKLQRAELIKKAQALKTKKAQAKAWDKVREIELQMENVISDAWSKVSGRHTGAVLMSGTDVLVKTEYGTFNAYACNDVLSKSWHSETCCVSYTRGQKIEFEFSVINVTHKGADVMITKISGGTLDEALYQELSAKPNLAFFKYPAGMSGLFATKAGA